jgi:FdhD protein
MHVLIPSRRCTRFNDNSWQKIEDAVPQEKRITITWPGQHSFLWAFPNELEELVCGHAAVEWCSVDHIPIVSHVEQNTYHLVPVSREWARPASTILSLAPKTILDAMDLFFDRTGLWETTGCFHRMGLFDPATNTLVHFVEDIARHNCIDRIAGWSVRTSRPLEDLILLCSSRVTGSLMSKIVRTGVPVIVSRSATTVAAIEQAEEHAITLLGFARKNRFTVFSDPRKHLRISMA